MFSVEDETRILFVMMQRLQVNHSMFKQKPYLEDRLRIVESVEGSTTRRFELAERREC